jgi:hypothetical protein
LLFDLSAVLKIVPRISFEGVFGILDHDTVHHVFDLEFVFFVAELVKVATQPFISRVLWIRAVWLR